MNSPTPSPTPYPTPYPTPSPTPFPTPSPTPSPTHPPGWPTPHPTFPPGSPMAAGAGGVAATGDPHLQNIHGERFDLMKPGKHVLINIPRGVIGEDALLRVQADARRLGGTCAEMYFQVVNVTGSWAEAKQAGGHLQRIAKCCGDSRMGCLLYRRTENRSWTYAKWPPLLESVREAFRASRVCRRRIAGGRRPQIRHDSPSELYSSQVSAGIERPDFFLRVVGCNGNLGVTV